MEDTSLIDWPLTLKELEPYYDKAEAKMGVSGTNGLPPSAENNHFKVLKAGAKRIGYRDITSERSAINSAPYDGRPKCRQIGFCTEGCAIGAKWSTLYTEIPKAEATGHFELRPDTMALKINHNKNGKATGVIYRDRNGIEHEQKARAVCVAGNVVETTRLLLLSKSPMFPLGLANSTDNVGKHYTRHVVKGVMAVMPGKVHAYKGTVEYGIVRDEHPHNPERGFAGGYIIESVGARPDWNANFAGWGASAQSWMESFVNTTGVSIFGEDPPQEGNRITLHPDDEDEFGLPVPMIEYTNHPNSKLR